MAGECDLDESLHREARAKVKNHGKQGDEHAMQPGETVLHCDETLR
jgi:hypothetical protein